MVRYDSLTLSVLSQHQDYVSDVRNSLISARIVRAYVCPYVTLIFTGGVAAETFIPPQYSEVKIIVTAINILHICFHLFLLLITVPPCLIFITTFIHRTAYSAFIFPLLMFSCINLSVTSYNLSEPSFVLLCLP